MHGEALITIPKNQTPHTIADSRSASYRMELCMQNKTPWLACG